MGLKGVAESSAGWLPVVGSNPSWIKPLTYTLECWNGGRYASIVKNDYVIRYFCTWLEFLSVLPSIWSDYKNICSQKGNIQEWYLNNFNAKWVNVQAHVLTLSDISRKPWVLLVYLLLCLPYVVESMHGYCRANECVKCVDYNSDYISQLARHGE